MWFHVFLPSMNNFQTDLFDLQMKPLHLLPLPVSVDME